MDGAQFILWTIAQGGYFRATLGTSEQYEEARRTGILRLPTDIEGVYDEIKWYFLAFGTVEDNFDRGLQRSRGDYVAV